METLLSPRYGLVVLDATILEREPLVGAEGWEGVVFRFLPQSPYRPWGLEELARGLRSQLEPRGWVPRCQTLNTLPLFGGPQYTMRAARGGEGMGLFLRPLEPPDTYRLEVGPADPNPPLTCPPR
ncbi:hypothetical protein [Thermus sp.]|uniref:hypothetical protein n=1 Tax=Thermus sp. TaxID=275 RepID=UPI00307F3CF5